MGGGALIGLAAALFLVLNGRITGISGDIAWRATFVLGLVGAPLVYGLLAALPAPEIEAGNAALIVAGLLFGVGWGIAGFRPGPALVALGMGEGKAVVFVLAMLAGMGLFEVLEHLKKPKPSSAQL